MVGRRKDAEARAFRARQNDRKALAALKRQEARIDKLIQAAIRRARAKAAAKAAKANHGGHPVDTNGVLMRPVNGPVTSSFGYREHPIYHYWGLHNGTDFGAGCGAPLYAAHGGTVLSRYYSSVWGNRLYLNLGRVNGHNVVANYNHATSYTVGVGTRVKRGQVVG